MLVVNLLGEPGSGKTATAAGVLYELLINNFKAEIIPEVAKGYAWDTPRDSNGELIIHPIFKQQTFLLGEQNRVLERVKGQREIAIMECPLIMSAVYKSDNYFTSFEQLVLDQFGVYDNLNILIERNHGFDPQGRVHNEKESSEVRSKLITFLEKNNLEYKKFITHDDINKEIVKYIRDTRFPDHPLKDRY